MSLNLTKGENINISKEAAGLLILAIGLGWDFKQGKRIDLDASALPYGEDGKIIEAEVCYFGRLSTLGGAVTHSGDNRTGAGDGDDETIKIDFSKLPANIKGFAITVNSFSGENFGEVNNVSVRAFDAQTNVELAKFDLTEDKSGKKGFELGRVYKHNEEWKFKATGTDVPQSLDAIVAAFTV